MEFEFCSSVHTQKKEYREYHFSLTSALTNNLHIASISSPKSKCVYLDSPRAIPRDTLVVHKKRTVPEYVACPPSISQSEEETCMVHVSELPLLFARLCSARLDH